LLTAPICKEQRVPVHANELIRREGLSGNQRQSKIRKNVGSSEVLRARGERTRGGTLDKGLKTQDLGVAEKLGRLKKDFQESYQELSQEVDNGP